MPVLSAAERKTLSAEYQRDCSSERKSILLSKADLQAAIDAIDAWAEANAAAFNQAIPQPARNSLTAKEKANLLFRVLRKRFEVV